MHGSPLQLLGHAADMDGKEASVDTAVSGGLNSSVWGAAAHYRQLLQHQHQQLQQHTEEEGNTSEAGSVGSREGSPRPRSDLEHEEDTTDASCSQDVLEKLKQQVASVTHGRGRKDTNDNDASPEFRLRDAASLQQQQQRHRLSPQSLLASSMAAAPPSLVPLPGLTGLTGYGGGGVGRAGSVSPPAREAASPPTSSSAGHSPRQPSAATGTPNGAAAQAPWNYEEQFKQLYEIDDNPKRKEFLDELFRFMQNRGTPINRLPIMAKQVLDLYELYNLVVARGGLVEVINKKLWQEIIKGLKLPSSITSAAFTLRTQYMKYLYPQECQKEGLSSPSELQAAVDGNRREGRRSSYTNNSYADFVQRSPLLSGQMAPSFGLGNGMPLPTTLHQQGLSPLSLVTSRAAAPGSNGPAGHPMPPSSPFLPGMGGPVLPSANDTLMTLWNLYSRQQHQQQTPSPPPGRRPEQPPPPPPAAPQSEALNLGVRREMARQEREREQQEREREQQERDRSRELEMLREREMEQREREVEMKREAPEDMMTPPSKRQKSEEEDGKVDAMPHTKMSISSKADGSLVLSMELNGVVYQGILFAQPSPTR